MLLSISGLFIPTVSSLEVLHRKSRGNLGIPSRRNASYRVNLSTFMYNLNSRFLK